MHFAKAGLLVIIGIGSPGSGTVNARFKLCGPRACTPKPNRGVLTRSQRADTVTLNTDTTQHGYRVQ